jgi:hypothetical protein
MLADGTAGAGAPTSQRGDDQIHGDGWVLAYRTATRQSAIAPNSTGARHDHA